MNKLINLKNKTLKSPLSQEALNNVESIFKEDLDKLLDKGLKQCQGSCFNCGFNCSKLNTISRVCQIH